MLAQASQTPSRTLCLWRGPGQRVQGILQGPELHGGELQLPEGPPGHEGRQDGARGLLDAQVPQVHLGKQGINTQRMPWILGWQSSFTPALDTAGVSTQILQGRLLNFSLTCLKFHFPAGRRTQRFGLKTFSLPKKLLHRKHWQTWEFKPAAGKLLVF